jgi:hypothetical protein
VKDIKKIFERITEHYDVPIRLSNRCETHVFYRVEDLSVEDLEVCAEYIADRVLKVCSPVLPQKLIKLPGCFTELAEVLSHELAPKNETLDILTMDQIERSNGKGSPVKNLNVLLVNDVITTARSCLEAHTKTTMMGATVLTWAALIDRTFGPGPVPVIAAFTGAPITLLE